VGTVVQEVQIVRSAAVDEFAIFGRRGQFAAGGTVARLPLVIDALGRFAVRIPVQMDKKCMMKRKNIKLKSKGYKCIFVS
jgi:hypothetical protein